MSDLLVPSPPDVVLGGFEVESRFLDLCGSYLRLKYIPLTPPSELEQAFFHWRKMRVRHKCTNPKCGSGIIIVLERKAMCGNCGKSPGGDYRHSSSELQSLKEIAMWTIRLNCEIRNQPMPNIDL